uniref:Dolichol phosphate-mannose biosynthesis regulatory protein n=1 Tax=Trichogramma kaykai TaxID=54128 RepID=A0ABD2XKB3_9HYME
MLSDREKGKFILISASVIFLYYTLWVIGYPFFEDDRLKAMFMSHSIALFVPAISGLIFIGGLTIFTIYHIRLHLNNKAKNR